MQPRTNRLMTITSAFRNVAQYNFWSWLPLLNSRFLISWIFMGARKSCQHHSQHQVRWSLFIVTPNFKVNLKTRNLHSFALSFTKWGGRYFTGPYCKRHGGLTKGYLSNVRLNSGPNLGGSLVKRNLRLLGPNWIFQSREY